MNFLDYRFYLTFAAVLVLLFLLQFLKEKRHLRAEVIDDCSRWVLLVYSYFIIYTYDWRFCLCIWAVTTFNFIGARCLRGGRRSKALVALLVACDVLFLGVFKYLNFFLGTVASIAGHQYDAISIILPLGISYYIFSVIAYVLSVYWETAEAEEDFACFALWVAFFPKLVCGPIVSAKEFLPQLHEGRSVSLKNLEVGVQIFAFGLFKKMVLADNIASFVEQVFATPKAFGSATVAFGVMAYSLQLYFDFSGYSDMAIGTARMLGFEFSPNFNLPYISKTIYEFWNRWHLSLSGWLTDNVFNPVALSVKRRMATLSKAKRKKYKYLPEYLAAVVTFLVSGIWHGAGWNFVVWGLCHGFFWIMENALLRGRKFKTLGNSILVILNFVIVSLIGVLFRADDILAAASVYKCMFSFQAGICYPNAWAIVGFVALILATAVAIYRSRRLGLDEPQGFYPILQLNKFWHLVAFFAFVELTLALAHTGDNFFIYGNF